MDDFTKAESLHAEGKAEEAAAITKRLLLENQNDWKALYFHGTLFAETGSDDAVALILLTRANELIKGKSAEVLVALGQMHRRLENLIQARYFYERALEIAPDEPILLTGYAGSFVNQGNPQEGIKWARKALDCPPGGHSIHALNSLSLLLLESGDWENGFKAYRSRSELPKYDVRHYGQTPRWDGSPVKSLVLHAEQGLGDEIMFASVIPEIKAMVPDLRFECADRLVGLFERSFGIPCYPTHRAVWESGFKPDAWDRVTDVFGSLRPTPESCPGTPYLKADPVLVESYRSRLRAAGEGPYTGLAWLGGTRETHMKNRRAPKELWLDLRQSLPGTAISLQYGPEGAADAKAWGLPHWQGALDNMDEFAALVAALDSVITSPQTAVYFAGALGIQTSVVMSSKPAWRYGLDCPTMPAFKSVSVVRQRKDNWNPVFERMRAEFLAKAA